jgi:cell wall-associated NlpC family hydrolase
MFALSHRRAPGSQLVRRQTVRLLFFVAVLLLNGTQAFAGTRDALLTQFRQWEGTPYQYGGNSHQGIDCSGFVHIIYRQALGLNVPRSTEKLVEIRHRVSRAHLKAGDIILFRINWRTMHAGIYIGNGQFIHASKSRGVMRSSLNNPYWNDVYNRAVRITKSQSSGY